MIVRHLDASRDPFRPREEEEPILPPQYPYLAACGALNYLVVNSRPDIAFAVNLLSRFSPEPTMPHWKGIMQVFRYLRGTADMGLWFPWDGRRSISRDVNIVSGETAIPSVEIGLVGYADAGFLSDPHKGRSQTGYVFLHNGVAISWKSTKQSMAATSSNMAEILPLHEASHEAIWLRSMTQHILRSAHCAVDTSPTIIHEDNAACVHQLQHGYIKGDRTKHLSPKFFYTSELHGKEINITAISSSNNLADLFTKFLPASLHHRLSRSIGLRKLSELRTARDQGESG